MDFFETRKKGWGENNHNKKMKRVLLIDAHSLIHRSFHALPPLVSKNGEPTGALYGTANTLLRVLKEKSPDYAVAAFDRPEPTFRKKEFEEYKANRPKAPDELVSQIKKSRELFTKFGIYTCEAPGYEGDDIIGTFARIFTEQKGFFVTILTGDLDTLQLVRDGFVEVETFKKGVGETLIYNEEGVYAKFGVPPSRIRDYKGLVGDQSDNIPGVPGVGPKTASLIISRYGTLENAFEQTSLLEDQKMKKIGGYKDIALMSKKLATIEDCVPIEIEDLEKTKYTPPDLGELKKYFLDLNFESLAQRIVEKEKKVVEKDELGGVYERDGIVVSYDIKEKIKNGEIKKGDLKNGFFDIKIAAWLCNPDEKDFSLDSIYRRFGKNNDIYLSLKKEISELGLERVFYEIETPIIPILAEMELLGICVNISELSQLEEKIKKDLRNLEKEIFLMSGAPFNINSPQQVSDVLFSKLKIRGKKKKTKTGMSSTAESVLSELRDEHPIIGKILEYRDGMKMLSTYVVPLGEFAKTSGDGRVHTTYLQTGTSTGRLSSEKPNLQNIPQESLWSTYIRNAFVAEQGFSLLSFDYSQLELRILAHVSKDEKLVSAFLQGKDIHNATASQIFNIEESVVTPKLRRIAKTLNFGVVYGMGPRAFSVSSGVSFEEARRFINEYFFDFSGVRVWQDRVKKEAVDHGVVKNENGRARFFKNSFQNERFVSEIERAAINMPIQSLGADIMKIALARVQKIIEVGGWKDIVRPILTIHDELIFEVRNDILKSVAGKIKKEMENAFPLSVPLLVDAKSGECLGKMEKYEFPQF